MTCIPDNNQAALSCAETVYYAFHVNIKHNLHPFSKSFTYRTPLIAAVSRLMGFSYFAL